MSTNVKAATDPEVKEVLEEAEDDLTDARALASTMGTYHAASAAEKFLRALALAAGRQVSPAWDLARVHAAVADLEGMDAIAEDARALSEFTTPAKAQGSGGRFGATMSAARRIRAAVLPLLGVDCPPEPAPSPVTEPAAHEPGPAVPPESVSDAGPGGAPPRDIGSDRGRERRGPPRDGYVKAVLLCQTCGVRLPRTRQTAHGRVPCPHCGRPMVMT